MVKTPKNWVGEEKFKFNVSLYSFRMNDLSLQIKVFGLVWFYGILTIVGNLMPNPF